MRNSSQFGQPMLMNFFYVVSAPKELKVIGETDLLLLDDGADHAGA